MQAIPKNAGHRVKEADKARIKCHDCGKPADVCHYMNWNTGNTTGISFFYFCDQHYEERKEDNML
jgi:hypothetical protein